MVKIKKLILSSCGNVPTEEGVYIVKTPKDFIVKFTGKTPNPTCNAYGIEKLQEKYNGLLDKTILYIGKGKNLKRRLLQYIKYGTNKGKTHKGGRAIFEIEKFNELEIEIKECKNCREVEKKMLSDYKERNKDYPLANWRN